jgi:hypothetical protein
VADPTDQDLLELMPEAMRDEFGYAARVCSAPPPELVRQWMERTEYDEHTWFYESYIAEQAARWGADQELEAVQKEIIAQAWFADPRHRLAQLRAARRPKPPSLKEQALGALGRFNTNAHMATSEMVADFDTIRRALEALND